MPVHGHVRATTLVVGLLMLPLVLLSAPAHAADGLTAQASAGKVGKGFHVDEKVKKRRASTRVLSALRIAQAQAGDPYVYGAAGPNAFDCSGLVYYATHRAGMKGVPRTSSAQAGYARHISRSAMRRGDLVFFTSGGRVYHVGIYVGFSGGRRIILHAPYSGQRVHREAIWTDSWFPGTLRGR